MPGKTILTSVKESYRQWKISRRDKNGKRARWNLGKMFGKRQKTKKK